MGGLKKGAPPILQDGTSAYVDPLPQALILTAIVIAFGVTSLILVMDFRAYQELKMDDMDQMRGNDQHE
ncbi:Na(+)/H(+) antiporter subunit C, partial [Klebsiella pneumoniae]|nr:Na(+)/H(+) antiporter subunit C [Klebsiella pneumoniae]